MHLFKEIICALLTIKTFVEGFPISPHTDLKEIGTIELKSGTIYKVLKPVEHRIEDHLTEALLRRDSKDSPVTKVFLDESGFRHFWTDMSDSKGLFRKANEEVSAENPNKDKEELEMEPFEINHEENIELKAAQGQEKNEQESNEAEAPESTTIVTTVALTTKPRPRKKVIKKNKAQSGASRKPAVRGGKQRTVAHTTFFCPFFGVIKMSRFID